MVCSDVYPRHAVRLINVSNMSFLLIYIVISVLCKRCATYGREPVQVFSGAYVGLYVDFSILSGDCKINTIYLIYGRKHFFRVPTYGISIVLDLCVFTI